MPLTELELNNKGFRWDLDSGLWQRQLRQSKHIVPGIGEGVYTKLLTLDKEQKTQSLEDSFINPGFKIKRRIAPFPLRVDTRVFVTAEPSSRAHHFNYCNYSQNAIYIGNTDYRAVFTNAGDLHTLQVKVNHLTDESLYIDFNQMTVGEIIIDKYHSQTLRRKPLAVGDNAIAFGNVGYYTEQSEAETNAVFAFFGQKEPSKITVPTTLNMDNLKAVLTGRHRDWIQLPEHIPVQAYRSPRY